MHHFVIVYDRKQRHIVREVGMFERADDALRARWQHDAEFIDDPEIEVVVLSAESEDDLRTTHARFFKTVAQLAS